VIEDLQDCTYEAIETSMQEEASVIVSCYLAQSFTACSGTVIRRQFRWALAIVCDLSLTLKLNKQAEEFQDDALSKYSTEEQYTVMWRVQSRYRQIFTRTAIAWLTG
jgi:hypothetical protein